MTGLEVRLTAPNSRTYIQPTGLFINNEWVKSSEGLTITSINPTDETEIVTVEAASPADIDRAVQAARKAFNSRNSVVSTECGDYGGSYVTLREPRSLNQPEFNAICSRKPRFAG